MAVMIYDFIEEIEEVKVRDISLYEEPVKYDPIEIDLVDVMHRQDRLLLSQLHLASLQFGWNKEP